MASTSRRIDMEKFNNNNFELWKLKMEDMLVDRDLWVAISSRKLVSTSQ
jgi:hypothetical protein